MDINEAFAAHKTRRRVWFIHYGEVVEGVITSVQSGGTQDDEICVAREMGPKDQAVIFTDPAEARRFMDSKA